MERLAQPSADTDRIGAIGICGGGAYTINAAITDHRMRTICQARWRQADRLFVGSRGRLALARE
ncbi:hypothetical protein AO738_19410 [Pseudomonas citronellolis]|nr:hypothetical protein AO738_19410 [Pseudomonas citronellolis]